MKIRISAIGSVALLAVATPSWAATLTPLDPQAIDSNSISFAGEPAYINFINELSFSVDLYWINFQGNRTFYQTIGANSQYGQPTFITHPWLLVEAGTGGTTVQGSGREIVGFLPFTRMGNASNPDLAYIREFAAAIPEPNTWLLLIAGFGLVGAASRRRNVRALVSA